MNIMVCLSTTSSKDLNKFRLLELRFVVKSTLLTIFQPLRNDFIFNPPSSGITIFKLNKKAHNFLGLDQFLKAEAHQGLHKNISLRLPSL